MIESALKTNTLGQTLAVQAQIRLTGTVGRLLKQIRDLESVAPLFVESGMICGVQRPHPLQLEVAGISTAARCTRTLGGFLYAAAGVRIDLLVENNAVKTAGQDSVCEIDDIDYEDQNKRFQLIGLRQAYALADTVLDAPKRPDLVLMDCPLLLNRSMVPLRHIGPSSGYAREYENAVEAIAAFWNKHRDRLYPWNPRGTVVASIVSERFGAIVHVSQQDLRTEEGQRHLLRAEGVDTKRLQRLTQGNTGIAHIGERRFINGILGNHARTAAFRLNARTPRMEPQVVADLGVIGFHYRSGPGTLPRLIELVGDEPGWDREALDRVAGWVTALTILRGKNSVPLPIQLAERETESIRPFLEAYRQTVREEMKNRDIEELWLSDFDAISLGDGDEH